MAKKLVIELKFDEHDYGDGDVDLRLKSIKRHPSTTLTEGDIDNLGDEIAQSDFWQVKVWSALQVVMGVSDEPHLKVKR